MNKYFKIRIFQPIVPEYRVALFDGLCEIYGDRLEVVASKGCGEDVSYPLMVAKHDYSHGFLKLGSLLWQKRMSLKGLDKGDVVVVSGDIHQLSSILLAIRAKIKGVKVVWWAHHWSARGKTMRAKLRLAIAKHLADVYLCYTRTGAALLSNIGFESKRVFFTGNTINFLPICKAIENWPTAKLRAFQQKNSLIGKNIILVCGVIRKKMRLDQLFLALKHKMIADMDVYVVIIGDGPERDSCETLARDLDLTERIIWVGATRNQEVMAPWFLSASIFVYPGPIGLSIFHAMAYGLPVITHGNANSQLPEYEAMETDVTGLTFIENDVGDLALKIRHLLEYEGERNAMSFAAKKKVVEQYSMQAMIANFQNAIETCANI